MSVARRLGQRYRWLCKIHNQADADEAIRKYILQGTRFVHLGRTVRAAYQRSNARRVMNMCKVGQTRVNHVLCTVCDRVNARANLRDGTHCPTCGNEFLVSLYSQDDYTRVTKRVIGGE